ncbi:hypothetical protein JIN85_05735 [Luteolibacter pohnpeiensis]|uniref:Uncharacterized protein n=1 Tax=Luteolibacter pohnpeiensis TaxID=454153 RepID=A0A934S2C2_9BACT|nr:hypothetical protein [Luteolibacter pohnpeiensis]MBK1881905.1 hypothetical protein [Luteolibacter pohnpeiensis]
MSSKEAGERAGYRIAAGICLLIGACMLVILAWFRETPAFWTNAGGYPLWLRDLVQMGFYPLLSLVVFTLIYHSCVLFSHWRGSAQLWLIQASLIAGAWIIVASAASLAFANNIVNLIEHRDLHSHPRKSFQPDDLMKPRD